MKFLNVISGIIVAGIGVLIGYGIYFVLSVFYSVSLWIAGLMHAPDSVAMVITMIVSLFYLGFIIVFSVVAVYLVFLGLALIFSD